MRLEEQIQVSKKYCPMCASKNVKVGGSWEELPRTEKSIRTVTYWHPLIECGDCGQTSGAFEAVAAMHDAACFAEGLITASEIKSIREGLGFKNAEDLAELLDLGSSTIKRWESRALKPNKALLLLLRLVEEHGVQIITNLKESQNIDDSSNQGRPPDNVVYAEFFNSTEKQKRLDKRDAVERNLGWR